MPRGGPMLVPISLILATVVTVDAPVTAVTVYSDRARVTRTAVVSVSGTERVQLPLLLDNVQPESIQVEASGGDAQAIQIRRVDIAHVEAGEFPEDEARAL